MRRRFLAWLAMVGLFALLYLGYSATTTRQTWGRLRAYPAWIWYSHLDALVTTARGCGSVGPLLAGDLRCSMSDRGFAVISNRQRHLQLTRDDLLAQGRTEEDWKVTFEAPACELMCFYDRVTDSTIVMNGRQLVDFYRGSAVDDLVITRWCGAMLSSAPMATALPTPLAAPR